MKIVKFFSIIFCLFLLISCGSKLPESYHMEKKYWDEKDYDEAINYIKYSMTEEEGLPRLSDPLTMPVLIKLVDKQNVSVVLEDNTLGIKHKNEIAQEFFDIARDITKIYEKTDKRDKFIYPLELVKSFDFLLFTQLLYFKVGNENLTKDAINPNDIEVQRYVKANEQIIVDNFTNNLEYLIKEDGFNEVAIQEYAEVLNTHYSKLIQSYPNANFNEMKNKAVALESKIKSPLLKSSVQKIISLIEKR